MTKISSSWTSFYKRVLPAIWLGILLLWTAIMLGIGRAGEALVADGTMMFVLPIAAAALGVIIYWKQFGSCADEVYDMEDSLLVRNRGREVVIQLADVESVHCGVLTTPHRVTLRLSRPCELGSRVTFIPQQEAPFLPFAKGRVAILLERRVAQARMGERAGR